MPTLLTPMNSLVWFRSDLRTADNHALSAALRDPAAPGQTGRGVVGLFLLSPGEWTAHDFAPVKVEFILRTLADLSRGLDRLGIPLLIRRAERPEQVAEAVLHAANDAGCDTIHFNREYELNEAARDARLAETGAAQRVRVFAHHDQCVVEPGAVRTQSGTPFTVFSPFKRRYFDVLRERGGARPLPVPSKPRARPSHIVPDPVPTSEPGWTSGVPAALWPAGAHEAQRRLDGFIEGRILRYKADRDTPAVDGTSTLSPYLTVGAISVRQCLAAALAANDGRLDTGHEGAVQWISELVWRDFYKHIVQAFPRVCRHRAFKMPTERIAWRTEDRELAAWKAGRTGFPIVDAAMRQLTQTGWMHNRLRMIAAMFLTKDLLIDWRLGERHFMLNLIDGDLASNNGGWQWSASTGTDAAPYFRIFNPTSQSRKCDPDGAFIRRFVPELAGVEGTAIHDPSTLPGLLRTTLDYAEPIVDHALARDRVMAAFKNISAA
ncbi:MAG: deoxyribodipyrimidine photo-lyase [Phycisphaerales bacterium]